MHWASIHFSDQIVFRYYIGSMKIWQCSMRLHGVLAGKRKADSGDSKERIHHASN